jgi:hypothetical protein
VAVVVAADAVSAERLLPNIATDFERGPFGPRFSFQTGHTFSGAFKRSAAIAAAANAAIRLRFMVISSLSFLARFRPAVVWF